MLLLHTKQSILKNLKIYLELTKQFVIIDSYSNNIVFQLFFQSVIELVSSLIK